MILLAELQFPSSYRLTTSRNIEKTLFSQAFVEMVTSGMSCTTVSWGRGEEALTWYQALMRGDATPKMGDEILVLRPRCSVTGTVLR